MFLGVNISISDNGVGGVPLLGLCVGEVLDRAASAYPNQPALVVCHQNRRYTYSEFRAEVELTARGFLHLGVHKGDRVGVWATNYAEWVIAQFATAKIGAILVNINPAYRAYELEYVLRQSECQTMVLIWGFRDCDYVSTLAGICPEVETSGAGDLSSEKLPHLRNLIFVGDGGTARHVPLERPRGNGPTCSGAGLENKGGIARLR